MDRRALLIGAAGGFCGLVTSPAKARSKLVVGQPAPPFTAKTFDGRKVGLADYRGDVLVLNFWATWCAPCREELPLIETYYRLRRAVGMRVLAVTDEDSAPYSALKPLQKLVSLDLARNFSGPYRDVKAFPTNYVIDRAGALRYAEAGAFTLDSLNDVLTPLFNEPAPPR